MKSIFKILFLVSVVLVVVVGCQNMPNITEPPSMETGLRFALTSIEPVEYPIWAGQNTLAGTLIITNDEYYLYVTFSLTDDWLLEETHVHVASNLGGIPRTNRGIPIPGQFQYSESHNYIPEYTYVIDLPPYGFECGQAIVIAAHAVVVQLGDENEIIEDETAWGGDNPGPGPRWWYFVDYTIQCNGEPPEGDETAFGGNYPGGGWNPEGPAGGAWWYYFDTDGPATQNIYAGQNLVADASVTYGNGYLTIDLGPNMSLQMVEEPVKIQGYAEGQLPDFRPAAGGFTTYKGDDLTVPVPYYSYYVIHLDVIMGE